ncbi:S9 family peptidase [Olivibacter domesticus]|uniref:Dipeptidyl aminopeptidase/acylaminoacyl peptidase n=1 Tax=Olivibacter domesticus TaxID=407022 RepID=A0A1H7TNR5_OLID1|nr:S9 family peptidase [Olivibacter domesticus]SEL86338.1 Dipeptidyl aminopeptidase/acylaminoacyl peptidase [Olivibacter domesticus]
MKTLLHIASLLIILIFNAIILNAQGTKADYERANNMRQLVKGKALNLTASILWMKGTDQVFYSKTTREGKQFIIANWKKNEKKLAFDHQNVAQQLRQGTKEVVNPADLPLTQISFPDSSKQLQFAAFNKGWRLNLPTNELREDKEFTERLAKGNRYWGGRMKEDQHKKSFSPDSQWVAYIKNYNVYVKRNGLSEKEMQLSFDGSTGEYYDSDMFWSPDSKKLVAAKVRKNEDHTLYLIESSPSDQLQPKLQTRNYLKPGDALPQRTPTLFLIGQKKMFTLPASLIVNQYDLSFPDWRKDSRSFTVEYNQRGHQRYSVIEMDATTGAAKVLIDEQSKTFIDYSGKKYRYDVADGKELIWASERDGWNHLYLYDGITGTVKNQITKGDWVVRKVVIVDEAKRQIIFAASGREKGQDPYLVQYYRVNFDGSELTALTKENANHEGTFSTDSAAFVDQYSRIDSPPVTVIRSAVDGKVLMELEKADIKSLLTIGWKMPEVFTAKGRDGQTDIWGIIVRPTNFDENKKYPVIEYIYAGPHSSFVPKSFQTLVPYGAQELAELGFIVVQMDGMGTSNRSKAFHDVCWKNLKDAGFPDRIAWMKAAAKKYSYMDISKVGIYGTSAGGQSSAGAMLFHPEFYKVAISSCGCHDNRMDKMWWNEQWMGYPIGPHYAESSNVENAYRLQGKLMLIVGELDDNVDPSSTLQVVNALIKANKNFDFIMVPGMGHSSGGDFGEHKRRDYFVKHLLDVEPPAW